MSSGPFGNPAHQWDYYYKCMVGGILSCGLTHMAVVPLDVVKCRMQVSTKKYGKIILSVSYVYMFMVYHFPYIRGIVLDLNKNDYLLIYYILLLWYLLFIDATGTL